MSQEKFKNRTFHSLNKKSSPKIMKDFVIAFENMTSPIFQKSTGIEISKIYSSNFRPRNLIEKTLELKGYYPHESSYKVVVNYKGFSQDFYLKIKEEDCSKLENFLKENLN